MIPWLVGWALAQETTPPVETPPIPVEAPPVEAPPAEVAPVPVVPAPDPVPVPLPVPAPPVRPPPAPVPAPLPVPVPVPVPRPLAPGPDVFVGPPLLTPPPPPPPAETEPGWTLPWSGPSGPSFDDLMPAPAPRGLGPAVGLALIAIVASVLAPTARTMSAGLLPTGLLPRLARWFEVGCRGLVVVSGIGVVLALVPDSLAPAVPWIAVAVALAVGWSARDALPDLVAWTFLTAEGRIRPGVWVRGDGFEGIVDALRPRVTWIVDARGRFAAVPNRTVMALPLRTDRSSHPEIEVVLHLPGVAPAVARIVLHEAALLSPWIAPRAVPEVGWDPGAPERWTVRIRLLDLRFKDRFVGTLPERVHEILNEQA